jgi:ribosomal protein L11 methyltransferase
MKTRFGVPASAGCLKAERQIHRQPLWRLSIITQAEAEDAVSALLETILGLPVATAFNPETGLSTVTAYLPPEFMTPGALVSRRRIPPVPARRQRSRKQIHEFKTHNWFHKIRAGLKHIQQCGLKTGPGKLTLSKLRHENWAESWKRHFPNIEIGPELLIKPPWSRRRLRKNQAVVVLNPGLSFGTGQHPTTAFCLQELVRGVKNRPSRSFLDIGTGSGILAIAAAKLGYSPVHAFDLDPEAVRVARANARANSVQAKLRISRADVARLPLRPARQYDVICANLLAPLLIAQRRRIVNRLRPDGTLVLAGILKSEFPQVRRFFAELGLKLAVKNARNEWRSASLGFARQNLRRNLNDKRRR